MIVFEFEMVACHSGPLNGKKVSIESRKDNAAHSEMTRKSALTSNTKKRAGVITGDVSNSQSYSDAEFREIIATLRERLTYYAEYYGGDFDIYRGDAFQLVVAQPQHSIAAAVGLRLALKAHASGVDMRMSVAVGEAQFRPSEVKTGTGDAFVLSGRGLDNIKPHHLTFCSGEQTLDDKTQLLTRFADAHINGLTQTQSQTLLAYLEATDKSHESVAAILDKNRSNVSRILNASNYKLIAEYLDYMERALILWVQGGTSLKTEQLTKED